MNNRPSIIMNQDFNKSQKYQSIFERSRHSLPLTEKRLAKQAKIEHKKNQNTVKYLDKLIKDCVSHENQANKDLKKFSKTQVFLLPHSYCINV